MKQAQVVGVHDDRTRDDLGVAFVLPVAGRRLVAGDVLEHCRSTLASFKVPKEVVIVNAYPTTASANCDKVPRDHLREQVAEVLEAARVRTEEVSA